MSGRVVGMTAAVVKVWARAKTPGDGYQTSPPREPFDYPYYPFSSTLVRSVTLDFEYSRS